MPRLAPLPLALACALAAAGALCAPAIAGTVGADLRVLNTAGKVLADQRQYTDSVRIRTDRRADCFGAGNEGSGEVARISRPTALGLVIDAAATDRDLRPVSLTDAFDFGLGVCGIGGFDASAERYWYLKRDHKGSQVGGDSLRVRKGDDILWYLAPTSLPRPPDELALVAPVRSEKAGLFTVRVFSWNDAGRRSPVAGAEVTGADLPTDAEGRATVALAQTTNLVARHGTDIPDDAKVCIGAGCAPAPALRITGTGRRDLIAGTDGANKVHARGGADRVNVRGGGKDRVICGAGRDTALLDRRDRARGCEVRLRR